MVTDPSRRLGEIRVQSGGRDNVLFFHATYVAPKWSNRLSRRYTIGNHIFYALNH